MSEMVERRVLPPAPRQGKVDLLFVLAALGFAGTVGLLLIAESANSLAAPGGRLTALGRLTGLVGTYFLLILIILIGRVPALERVVGQDKLVHWHALLAPWTLVLLIAHTFLIAVGYAQGLRMGSLRELGVIVVSYPWMLAATAGLGLLLLAGFTSYRRARRHMRYETWWSIHLYTYLAAALSVPHQLATGASFLGHPWARAFWIGLWALTAGIVLVYRVGLPVWRSLRHRLSVVAVQDEAPGVVSVILTGRRLDRLPIAGGQFLQWRFLRRGLWWQAHPYSLSAVPSRTHARITVRTDGDHGKELARLLPGTRVLIEGPYGIFTPYARTRQSVLLVGAGVGISPLRALLDDLPPEVDVVVILRGSSESDLILRDEIARLIEKRGGRLHELVGSRHRVRLDAETLRWLVPDIAERDLYVCGPRGFLRGLLAAARRLGVPQSQIHHERFSF